MKAIEWAQRFDNAEVIGPELEAFIAEIGEIATKRGNTPNAIEGAVREQKKKFVAACEKTTKVKLQPAVWHALMLAHGQEYIKGINQYLVSCQANQSVKAGKPNQVTKK